MLQNKQKIVMTIVLLDLLNRFQNAGKWLMVHVYEIQKRYKDNSTILSLYALLS